MAIDVAKLREILASDEAYAILDRAIGGSWLAGGCLLLAKTLRRIQPGSEIFVIHRRTPSGGPSPQHCVLGFSGRYVDADGASSEEDLVRYWGDEEGIYRPYLLLYGGEDLGEIVSDHASEEALAIMLMEVVV